MRLDISKVESEAIVTHFDETYPHYEQILLQRSPRSTTIIQEIKQLIPLLDRVDRGGTVLKKYRNLLLLKIVA